MRLLEAELGPFKLIEPVGAGGMGTVWRATHRPTGRDVALKVIHGERARQGDHAAALRREIRAAAGLDHPSIVRLLDRGEVSASAADRTAQLVAGSPWVAMELASNRTLRDLPLPRPWAEVRGVAMALLDALAHAHSRGVIHRDLKPSNILLTETGILLTDFGLAEAMDDVPTEGQTGVVSGTPAFMAPEQLFGHFREYGPWTDLYALGCVIWELATGTRPFEGGSVYEVAFAHMKDERPGLPSLPGLPDGLGAWLGRLIAREPKDRFRRAADAAWALTSLGGEGPVLPTSATRGEAQGAEDDPTELAGPGATRVFEPLIVPAPGPAATHGEASDRPPVPATWGSPSRPRSADDLLPVGLGLFGLRRGRLVGRKSERGALWAALREVAIGGSARLVVLQGEAGCGKSALARWLAEASHELGVATPLVALHGPAGGAAEGLSAMLARHHRCQGLDRAALVRRLRQILSGRDQASDDENPAAPWFALAELIEPATEEERSRHPGLPRITSTAHRHAVARREVERLAAQRPVVLWFDDVHFSSDSLAFLEELLQSQGHRPAPILALATARTESLARHPLEAERLNRCAALPRAQRYLVDVLDEDDHDQLLGQLLGLDVALHRRLSERTAGNPLFAIQLVGDWVQRGVLVPGPDGLVVRAGEEARLPDDLFALWGDRLAELFQRWPTAPGPLEIAAVLGQEVDITEWSAVAASAGTPVPDGLAEALVDRRLVQLDAGVLSFSHGMLREALERRAEDAGTLAAHHRACADVLDERGTGAAGRAGRHRLRGGEPERAMGPLRRSIRDRIDHARYSECVELLDDLDSAFTAAALPESDPRRAAPALLRAERAKAIGECEEAVLLAEDCERSARRHHWTEALPRALFLQGEGHRKGGMLEPARAKFEAALALLTPNPTAGHSIAECELGLAQLKLRGGEMGAAETHYRRAMGLLEAGGWAVEIANPLKGLGDIARRRGQLEVAEETFHRAYAIEATEGDLHGAADSLIGLGEVARARGQLESAEGWYGRAMDLYEAVGSLDGIVARANLGLVRIQRGRYGEARDALEPALRELDASNGPRWWVGALHANLLAPAAARCDWQAFDEHLAEASRLLAETGVVDEDIAWPAELAVALAEAAEEPRRAAGARRLAEAQRAGLVG